MSETVVDARGLRCPMPLLKARKALATLPPGARLQVWATDRGAPADFKAYCAQTGHELLGVEPGVPEDDDGANEASSPAAWLKITLVCQR